MGSEGAVRAEMIGNVQFIYELAFAKLELKALGVKYNMDIGNEVRFELIPPFDEDLLLRRLSHFESIGHKITDYSRIVNRNVTRSENQYLTHWYYPYKGKFHPRVIRAILNIMGLEIGQTVLDPFVGSGTTALEAHLLGINSFGFDILPTCIIQSKVKITAGEVADIIPQHRDRAVTSMRKDFEKSTTESSQRNANERKSSKNSYGSFLNSLEDERVREFYRLAQLIFASDIGRRHRGFNAFERNLDKMITSGRLLAETQRELAGKLGKAEFRIADARSLPLGLESVDGIVTSPPYSIALDYVENDRHALKELNENLDKLREKCIGVRGKGKEKLSLYKQDMQRCYSEMYRVLKPDSQCVIIIGEAVYDEEDTTTVKDTIEFCEKIGFRLKENIPKKIFGLYNTIKDENVLFFQK